MILLSRLNGAAFYLNAEMVQVIESTPDTVITLTTHEKMVVKEPAKVVVDRMIEYQQHIHCPKEPAAVVRDPQGD